MRHVAVRGVMVVLLCSLLLQALILPPVPLSHWPCQLEGTQEMDWCVCVCVRGCMHAWCVCVCVCVCVYECEYACMVCVCVCVCMSASMHAWCMCVCVHDECARSEGYCHGCAQYLISSV